MLRSAVMFEPPLQVEILFHPSAAGIDDQAGKLQALPLLQILVNQNFPLLRESGRHPRITIPGEIDEIERILDTVKVNSLRSTRRGTCESQPLRAGQGGKQAGLTKLAA